MRSLMTKHDRLVSIKKSFKGLNSSMRILSQEYNLDDYSFVLLKAYITTELLIQEVLIDNGVDISMVYGSVFTYAIKNNYIPSECKVLYITMRDIRNRSAHGENISYEETYVFSKAYDVFLYWIFQKYDKIFIFDDINIKEYIINLSEFLILRNQEKKLYVSNIDEVLKLSTEILSKVNQIDKNVLSLSNKIDNLSHKISDYQALMQKQFNLFNDEKDRDKLIAAFVDECSEKIIDEFKTKEAEQEKETQEKKLILSLGEETWNKLELNSRTFLVSSKIVFDSLILKEDVDYSSVCLLVTKALELELSKRFCDYFISFLKNRYKDNYSLFPTCLLDKYGNPIRSKNFTMGTFAYLVGYNKDGTLTDSQIENNNLRLLEYVREELLSNKTDDEIIKLLHYYAQEIETVKINYRNPAAHTKELTKIDAEQCFNLVLYVEQLLKKMITDFSK